MNQYSALFHFNLAGQNGLNSELTRDVANSKTWGAKVRNLRTGSGISELRRAEDSP